MLLIFVLRKIHKNKDSNNKSSRARIKNRKEPQSKHFFWMSKEVNGFVASDTYRKFHNNHLNFEYKKRMIIINFLKLTFILIKNNLLTEEQLRN